MICHICLHEMCSPSQNLFECRHMYCQECSLKLKKFKYKNCPECRQRIIHCNRSTTTIGVVIRTTNGTLLSSSDDTGHHDLICSLTLNIWFSFTILYKSRNKWMIKCIIFRILFSKSRQKLTKLSLYIVIPNKTWFVKQVHIDRMP